jgi:hypothetical protein
MKRVPLWLSLALLPLLGCGDDGFNSPDGGGGYCESVVMLPPSGAIAPASISVSGSITGPASGADGFEWSVRKEGEPSFSVGDPGNVSSFSFTAPSAGFYEVTLFGSAGSVSCTSDTGGLNVVDGGADSEFYRLRVVPSVTDGAPIQEHVREVVGSDAPTYDVGTISLDEGFSIDGMVRDSVSDPVQAYLRFTTIGDVDPMSTETFSSALGTFDVTLSSGMYDVLIVPQDNGKAPVELTGVGVNSLDSLVVPAAMAISGTVLDPTGTAVSGATVSLDIDGVPTTIATTDPAGVFIVLGHPGGATSIHVSPPAGSGLPELVLDDAAGLIATSTDGLAIQYAPGLTSRSLSVPVTMLDGSTPAPNARVTFVSRAVVDAGTVSSGGAAALPMVGAVRVTVTADGSGDLPATMLPDAVYDVIVEPHVSAPPTEGVSLMEVDMQMGVPSPVQLSLAEWATVTGDAVDVEAAGIDLIRVTAIPTGVLAGATTASASSTTDAGTYALSVAGGGAYDLVFDASDYGQARARLSVQAGAAGDTTIVSNVEMPDALEVTGSIELDGNPLAGVSITLLCYECSGDKKASLAIAEAVSEIDGAFSLATPNPGDSE